MTTRSLVAQIDATETALQEAWQRRDSAAATRLRAEIAKLWSARREEIARERATGRWEHLDPWVLSSRRPS